MKHVPRGERAPAPITVEGASGVSKAGLITAADGAPNAAMRHFRLDVGGNTPFHAHDWEYVVYVLAGEGAVRTNEGETALGPGDALIVPEDEEHNFLNRGDEPFEFLCIVPLRGD